MPIRGQGTYVSSQSTAAALVSSNRNSVCAHRDCSTMQTKTWQEEMIVRCTPKTLSRSTPKTNANASTDFPDAYILPQYLCRSCIHLVNPGGFPEHPGKRISPRVVQGSQRAHKAQISHEKQCKQSNSIVPEPTAATIRSLQWNAGAGERPVCEQRQEKDSFDLRILHRNW